MWLRRVPQGPRPGHDELTVDTAIDKTVLAGGQLLHSGGYRGYTIHGLTSMVSTSPCPRPMSRRAPAGSRTLRRTVLIADHHNDCVGQGRGILVAAGTCSRSPARPLRRKILSLFYLPAQRAWCGETSVKEPIGADARRAIG